MINECVALEKPWRWSELVGYIRDIPAGFIQDMTDADRLMRATALVESTTSELQRFIAGAAVIAGAEKFRTVRPKRPKNTEVVS